MTAPNPAPDREDDTYWRAVDLLAAFSTVAITDTADGATHLHADTIDKLARLIADDVELARLYRAQIWAGDRS